MFSLASQVQLETEKGRKTDRERNRRSEREREKLRERSRVRESISNDLLTLLRSLSVALEQLLEGPCFHGSRLPSFSQRDIDFWLKAIQRPPDSQEWKDYLKGEKAILDYPIVLFYQVSKERHMIPWCRNHPRNWIHFNIYFSVKCVHKNTITWFSLKIRAHKSI